MGPIISVIISWINPLNWVKWGYDQVTKAKLVIYYDPNETYHVLPDLSVNLTGRFCHVMVRNIGKKDALSCIGELRKIEKEVNGNFETILEYRNIMQLKWAHEADYSLKDIESLDAKRLDVCYVHQGVDVLHFFTKKYPSGNQTDFSPGKYRITLRVRSSNVASVDKKFIVEYFRGDFNSLLISNC